MNQSVTTYSVCKQRMREWIPVVFIVLAAGPPIGGAVFVVISLFLQGWEMLLPMLAAASFGSYLVGLPVAVIALTLFLPLQHFIARGTVYLAMLCGALAAEIALFFWALTLQLGATSPSPIEVGTYISGFFLFGIPAAISAAACWRITRHLHQLK